MWKCTETQVSSANGHHAQFSNAALSSLFCNSSRARWRTAAYDSVSPNQDSSSNLCHANSTSVVLERDFDKTLKYRILERQVREHVWPIIGIHYRESPRQASATAAGYPGASDCWRHTLRARKGRSPLSSMQHKVHFREVAGNFHSATRIFATPVTHVVRWRCDVISSLNTRYFLLVTWPSSSRAMKPLQ